MGATDPDAHGSHYNIDGGRLFGISKVDLEESLKLGVAKKADTFALDSALTPRLDIRTGERDATCRSLDAEQWVRFTTNGPEQSNQRNAWHEEFHA